MRDERLVAFLRRSHRRVVEHCEALLSRSTADAERSRLAALRAAAEADMQEWTGVQGR